MRVAYDDYYYRMTGPDCAVMCNLINIHSLHIIHIYIHTCFCAHTQTT